MALGFQDCCNSSSYFYLDGIPATVSQNEFYHIITLEGPAFCATYTTIPALNYLPPTYTLIEMTEYASCETCFAGAPLTCPSQETIFLSQFGPGSISVGTDCSIRTLFPMIVECISTNPTFDGFADGVVRLFVTGGTPPYSFFNLTDGTVFGGALPVVDSTYTLIDGALEGEYPIQVVDAQADYNITVNCVLESPPTELTLVATPTAVSFVDECDGTIIISVTNGTPPYQIFVNGLPVTETTLVDLCAGDYEITAIDSGVGTDQQITSTTVTIGEPVAIVYPDRLCLSFSYCGTRFPLTFTRSGDFNSRANYTCDNPQDIGLAILFLRWEAGWTTTQQTSNGNLSFEVPCAQPLPSLLVQFVKISNQTEQPTGNWEGPLGLFQGVGATVDPGVCVANVPVDPPDPPAQPILAFTTNNAQCGQVLGSVILVGSGGAGAPYTYSVNGVVQPSSTVTLPPGSYVATVSDVNGVNSVSSNFTIGTVPLSNISMTLSTEVDTTLNDQNTVVLVEFQGGSYQPVKTSVTVFGLPGEFDFISGYFNITIKKQTLFNDVYDIQDQSPPLQEIDFSNMGLLNNQVPPPQFYYSPSSSADLYPPYVVGDVVTSVGVRPIGVNSNLLPLNQSSGCVSPGNTWRTVTRTFTIGASQPMDFFNGSVLDFWVAIDNRFKPGSNSECQPAVGVQFTVEFVQTSVNIACTNFVFNGGVQPYIASTTQIGNVVYLPHIYTNTQIID